jgi:hypothetical protein
MLSKRNDDELYQAYLAKVYQHTQGFQSYSSLQRQQFSEQGVCITYGELLYASVKKIIRTLKLSEDDVFLDLGSGLGKCAMQVFMQTPAKKIIGIEASSALHLSALTAQQKVKIELPYLWDDRAFDLVEGNFLQASWQRATAVYSCSTCFTQELLVAMGRKMNEEKQLTQILSLRPLPSLERLRLQDVFSVECSWDSALCYYYTLRI